MTGVATLLQGGPVVLRPLGELHAAQPSSCVPCAASTHLGTAQGLVVMQAQVAPEPDNAGAAATACTRPCAAVTGSGLAGRPQLATSACGGVAAVRRCCRHIPDLQAAGGWLARVQGASGRGACACRCPGGRAQDSSTGQNQLIARTAHSECPAHLELLELAQLLRQAGRHGAAVAQCRGGECGGSQAAQRQLLGAEGPGQGAPAG